MPNQQTRIIGIGNPLMGDDGLGCKLIELLQKNELPKQVSAIDAGCAGLQLLPLMENCDRLILVDAADFSSQPGSFKILKNRDLGRLTRDCGRSVGHQIGLPEVLQTAHKLGQLPPFTLYLMQVKSCQPATRLSFEIERALPALLKAISASL